MDEKQKILPVAETDKTYQTTVEPRSEDSSRGPHPSPSRFKIKHVLVACLLMWVILNPLSRSGNKASLLEWQDDSERCGTAAPWRMPTLAVSTMEFDSWRNISIVQLDEGKEDGSSSGGVSMSGNVVLVTTDDASPGRITVEALTNNAENLLYTDWSQDDQIATFGVDETSPGGLSCIQILITISIPSSAPLNHLTIHTTTLDISPSPDLNLPNPAMVSLLTSSGTVTHPSYASAPRETWVKTISGDIKGTYPLYDILSLRTVSGTVDVNIIPESIDPGRPRPALLNVASVSGTVTLREEQLHGVPERDYIAQVKTVSGTVTADSMAVSSEGTFKTQSGSMRLDILPVLTTATGRLDTKTRSGTTRVEIHEPASPANRGPARGAERGGGALLDHFYSHHGSISGTVEMRYPEAWEGELEATSVSGSMRYRGHDLETGGAGVGKRLLRGRKGDGESRLLVSTVSGTQDFVVGRELPSQGGE